MIVYPLSVNESRAVLCMVWLGWTLGLSAALLCLVFCLG